MKKGFIIVFAILSFVCANAQDVEDNSFEGRFCYGLFHRFGKDKKWMFNEYFEYVTPHFNRLDYWFNRVGIGYYPVKWLNLSAHYDLNKEFGCMTHRGVAMAIASTDWGHTNIFLREQYIHTWNTELGTEGDILRSMLQGTYQIPNSKFQPYLAVELYSWKSLWERSKQYVGCYFNLTKQIQFEAFYIYYAIKHSQNRHIVGAGLYLRF